MTIPALTASVGDLKKDTSHWVDVAVETGQHVTITRNRQPRAVLISTTALDYLSRLAIAAMDTATDEGISEVRKAPPVTTSGAFSHKWPTVLRAAAEGEPQEITKHGHRHVVIVGAAQWRQDQQELAQWRKAAGRIDA